MEVLRLCLRYIHLVGFAVLFGAYVAQFVTGRRRVNVLMRVGLATTLLSGLVLAVPFPQGIELDYGKLAVKLGVVVLIGACFGIAVTRERSGRSVPRPIFLGIGGLVLINAAVAVFWT